MLYSYEILAEVYGSGSSATSCVYMWGLRILWHSKHWVLNTCELFVPIKLLWCSNGPNRVQHTLCCGCIYQCGLYCGPPNNSCDAIGWESVKS